MMKRKKGGTEELIMLRIVICDDDLHMLNKMKNIVEAALAGVHTKAKIQTFSDAQQISRDTLARCDIALLDIDFENASYNGMDIARQLRKFQNDAIIIFAGTNDFNASVPLGWWYDEARRDAQLPHGATESRTYRCPSMDKNTFRGRINRLMDFLKTNFPTKQVIMLTPLHRGFAQFSPENVQPEEAFPNRLGIYVDAYVQTVKEAGNVWAVPVIDLNSLSGLYPLNDAHAQYFHQKSVDRLHPNAEGHRRMALTLKYQLLSLPSSFE